MSAHYNKMLKWSQGKNLHLSLIHNTEDLVDKYLFLANMSKEGSVEVFTWIVSNSKVAFKCFSL